MHVLFASDSLKGSLSSQQTGILLTKAFHEVMPEGTCQSIAMADGGEGTLEALLEILHGETCDVAIQGPDGRDALCTYGLLPEGKAIIEMAKCAGITMVEEETRNPMEYGTYGMGQAIRDALEKGCTTIYLCIGGSATMDGGMGCMEALGVQFLDADGKPLKGIAKNLGSVETMDCTNMCSALAHTQFVVLCDVTNPLCGKDGAVYTFGAQKGADKHMQDCLEEAMNHYADVLDATFSIQSRQIVGGGAAGGMGAALSIFLKAHMQSGIEAVLELAEFDSLLEGVDLVVTGEGRSDWQSANGKVVSGIAAHCKKKNIPVVALCGALGDGYEALYDCGVSGFMTLPDRPMSLEASMENAPALYYASAKRMFELIFCLFQRENVL